MENRIKCQVFSFTSGGNGGCAGVWGPVRRSVALQQGVWLSAHDRSMAVCRDVVHWLGGSTKDHWQFTRTVALHLHTGRTWITELPEKIFLDSSSTLLATTGDGQLSVISSLKGHQVQVWVLNNGGEQWSLQQTVDVQKQLPHCREDYMRHSLLSVFCPRSGCVIAMFAGQEIRINLESGPGPRVDCIGKNLGCRCKPYEMDWSTYISKMKPF